MVVLSGGVVRYSIDRQLMAFVGNFGNTSNNVAEAMALY